jgi:hypothetical protein
MRKQHERSHKQESQGQGEAEEFQFSVSDQAPGDYEENVVAEQIVPYLNEEVLIVLLHNQTCYTSIQQSCQVLGLNPRGQLQRIQRTPELAEGLRQLSVHTRGGVQKINCIRLNLVPFWLSSMQNRMLTPDLRRNIDAYYLLLTEVAQDLQKQATAAPTQRIVPPPTPRKRRFELDEDQDQLEHPPRKPKKRTQLDEDIVQPHLLDLETIVDEEPPDPRMLLTTLPGITSTEVLVTTGYQEDRAIREATLARQMDWQEEPISQRKHYLASNKLLVTIGDPEHPLGSEEAEYYIQQLDESTVLTARIILGIWNIRRSEQQLAKDGSAAIRIDDILEWRGVKKHQRAIYTGAQRYTTDGYQWKHKQEVHQDIKLLELFHLRGKHVVNVKGKSRQFVIDGPYLRVTSVKEQAGQTEEDIIGYFVAPGAWINTYEENGNLVMVEIDRRIFQLHPQNDQIALRIALYLTEHWRLHFRTGRYAEPINMQDLLVASMIPIDRINLTSRFAPRVEAALQKLYEKGIVGSATQLTTIDRTQNRWGKEWLNACWRILPPDFLSQRMQQGSYGLLPMQEATQTLLLPPENTEPETQS